MAECKEELTGRILQTETNGNDFVLDAASQPSRWKPKQGWRSVLEVAAVVGLVALLATVIALAVVLSRNNSNRGIDPACIHALGGGPIKNGGSMEIKAPDYCKAQLRAYADNSRGSYWRVSHATMTKRMQAAVLPQQAPCSHCVWQQFQCHSCSGWWVVWSPTPCLAIHSNVTTVN